MTDFSPALSVSEGGTIITIEVSAGASERSFPSGYNAWRKAVGCRVRSPAREGRANREVIAAIAETTGIGKGRIRIVSGATSPVKRVLLEGIVPGQLLEILARYERSG